MQHIYISSILIFLLSVSYIHTWYASGCSATAIDSSAINKAQTAIKTCIEEKPYSSTITLHGTFACGGNTEIDRAYQAAVSALMWEYVDKEVKKVLEKLKEERSKDVAIWTNTISDIFDPSPRDVCKLWENADKICGNYATTSLSEYFSSVPTDTVPNFIYGKWKALCDSMLQRKMATYRSMAWTLANKNIQKSFQNDKNAFMWKVKDTFEMLAWKFINYKWNLETMLKWKINESPARVN